MKKLVVIFSLILTSIVSMAQMSPETMKALGIAPRKEEFSIPPYEPINFIFSNKTCFISSVANVRNNEIIKPEPLITFLFDGNVITTSYKTPDGQNWFQILGKFDDGKYYDDFFTQKFFCKDAAGSPVTLTLSVNAEEIHISIYYTPYKSFNYIVSETNIPEVIEEININNGIFGENNAEDLSWDEFKNSVNADLGFNFINPKTEELGKRLIFWYNANGVTSADNKPKRWQKGSSVDDQHIVIEKK